MAEEKKRESRKDLVDWLRALLESNKHYGCCGPDCPCHEIKEHLGLRGLK